MRLTLAQPPLASQATRRSAAATSADQPRPSGLVAGAESGARVAVEVFVEQHPGRRHHGSSRNLVSAPLNGPLALRVRQEQIRDTRRDSSPAPLPPSVRCVPEPVGHSTVKSGAVVVVKLLQRPRSAGSSPGTTPARASWNCLRTGRFATRPARALPEYSMPSAAQAARLGHVAARQSPDAVRRGNSRVVQHGLENAAQLIAVHHRQQPALAVARVPTSRRRARSESGRLAMNQSSRFEKPGRCRDHLRLERLDRQQRNQTRPSTVTRTARASRPAGCSTS